MKVGDLVSLKMKKTQPPQIPRGGVIVNTWKNHYHKLIQIEILWAEGNITKLSPDLFEVINANG
jgi:hypothetical protein